MVVPLNAAPIAAPIETPPIVWISPCTLDAVPGNYLNWIARQGFTKGELGQLLALMHQIDHNGLKHLLQPLRRLR